MNFKELKITDPEPPAGSIVMLHGETGTATQRFYSDGNYHAVTGKVYTYADLFKANENRAPLLVFEAPEDEEV